MNPELSSLKNSKLERLIHRLWHWFIAPSPQIKEQDQRRQATLLSTFLLAIVFLSLIVEIIGLALYGWGFYITDQVAITTALILAIIYGISRTRYAPANRVFAPGAGYSLLPP